MDLTEEAQVIIAALRNPANQNSMVVKDIKISGVAAKAVCWITAENTDITVSPMVVIVNPKLFEKIELE